MAPRKHTDAELDSYIGKMVNDLVGYMNAARSWSFGYYPLLNSPMDSRGHLTPTARSYFLTNVDGSIDGHKDGVIQHDELKAALIKYLGASQSTIGQYFPINSTIESIYNFAGRDNKMIEAYVNRREAELGLKIEQLDDQKDKPPIRKKAGECGLNFQGAETTLLNALGTMPIQPRPARTARTP